MAKKPTAPGTVKVIKRTSTSVRLKWSRGNTHGAGKAFYVVKINGKPRYYPKGRTLTVKGLKPSRTYRFGVQLKSKTPRYSNTTTIRAKTKAKPKKKASSTRGWVHPLKGAYVSSNYGMRNGTMHQGIDLVQSHKRRVKSAHSGTVHSAGWITGYGNTVIVRHGKFYTLYAHLDSIDVRSGQKVKADQTVGRQGTTGDSTGSHLHFEVHNGLWNRVNPKNHMAKRKIRL